MELSETERKLLELSSRMQGLPVHPPEIVQEREQLWTNLFNKVSWCVELVRYLPTYGMVPMSPCRTFKKTVLWIRN